MSVCLSVCLEQTDAFDARDIRDPFWAWKPPNQSEHSVWRGPTNERSLHSELDYFPREPSSPCPTATSTQRSSRPCSSGGGKKYFLWNIFSALKYFLDFDRRWRLVRRVEAEYNRKNNDYHLTPQLTHLTPDLRSEVWGQKVDFF